MFSLCRTFDFMNYNNNIIFKQFYNIAISNFKSDAQLASFLGISRGTFGKYTRKENPVSPNLSTIVKWCELINIKINENIFKKNDL